MSLDDTISAAVDRVTSDTPASPAATSEAPSTPAPDAAASSATAPAAASGSEAAPAPTRSTDAPTTPASVTAAPVGEPAKAEPPREKWDQILGNARTKALSDYGLTGAENREALRGHIQALTRDPVAYYQSLGHTLRANGLLTDTAAPQAPAVSANEPDIPEGDLLADDGTRAYSQAATVKLVQAQVRHALVQFQREQDERFKPLADTTERLKVEEIYRAASDGAAKIYDEVHTWPHFETLKPRIAELVKAATPQKDMRPTMIEAYNTALREHLPTHESALAASTRTATLGELKTTAQGSKRASTPAPDATVGVGGRPKVRGSSLDSRLDRALDSVGVTI